MINYKHVPMSRGHMFVVASRIRFNNPYKIGNATISQIKETKDKRYPTYRGCIWASLPAGIILKSRRAPLSSTPSRQHHRDHGLVSVQQEIWSSPPASGVGKYITYCTTLIIYTICA